MTASRPLTRFMLVILLGMVALGSIVGVTVAKRNKNTYIKIDEAVTREWLGCIIPKDRRIKPSEPRFFSGMFVMRAKELISLSLKNVNLESFTSLTDSELINA